MEAKNTISRDVPDGLTLPVAAFATASFVALSGVIGFVGLMVPHLARALVGPLHGPLTLVSAGIGAVLLLVGDIAARTILAPQELPLGIVIGALGAIFVILLVRRRRSA
ncbi:MAG: iron chelate uptake ABC transporter family permease subunit [Pseudomonadota bacterium]